MVFDGDVWWFLNRVWWFSDWFSFPNRELDEAPHHGTTVLSFFKVSIFNVASWVWILTGPSFVVFRAARKPEIQKQSLAELRQPQ